MLFPVLNLLYFTLVLTKCVFSAQYGCFQQFLYFVLTRYVAELFF